MLPSGAREGTRRHLANLGLADWSVTFDRAKKRAGMCIHSTKTISLSEYYVRMNDWSQVEQTVLHEIAHALAGPGQGHNFVWARKCRELGIVPERCYNSADVNMPQGLVRIICENHGEIGRQHRMPRSNSKTYKVCRKCRSRLTYRRTYA